MPRENQKLKLLYLVDILMEKTDEEHLLTANELCHELEKYEVSAERKAIYRDMALLKDEYGLDIIEGDKKNPGYALGEREFELAELKLLVDAVQASRFITVKKTESLIRKLEKLTSKYEAQQLQRQVYIYNRTKAENETIYYNIDMIHDAISSNVQIRFQYVEWTREKKLQVKKNGTYYQISPWSLTWDNQYYYMIGYDHLSGRIKYYRVDKMRNMSLTEEKRLGSQNFDDFDLASFARKTFSMYGGPEANVTLRCKNHLSGVILDRFGTEVIMRPDDDGHFITKIDVAVSSQFYGWLAGMGDGIEIIDPADIREEYKAYIERIVEIYNNSNNE